MSTISRLITVEELVKLPDNGVLCELHRGKLFEFPYHSFDHGIVCATIGSILCRFIKARRLGKAFGTNTGFVVEENPDTVLVVDFAFISRDRVAISGSRCGYLKGAPDLIVEVLSRDDSIEAAFQKADQWIWSGAQHVWMINLAERVVTIQQSNADPIHMSQGETIQGIDFLPGFSCPVAEIFADLV